MFVQNHQLKNFKDNKTSNDNSEVNYVKMIYKTYLWLTPSYDVVILDWGKSFYEKNK